MDNKVIEVLDYMGEKLGIAVDWTAENVLPQVTEFMSRYRMYAIAEHGVNIIVDIVLVFIAGMILKIMFEGIRTKDNDNVWYDLHWETGGAVTGFIAIALIGLAVFAITTAIDHILDITKWSFIPEVQFFETFSEYLKSAN